jgi:hypothetical protein
LLVQTQIYNEVYLELGKPLNLDAILKDEVSNLVRLWLLVPKVKFLVVVGRVRRTTIGRKELTALPTISRSAEDFTRLEPSVVDLWRSK